MEKALKDGLLVPISDELCLEAKEGCTVYAIFKPSPSERNWLRGKLKKVTGTISIRLIGMP